MSMPVIRAPEAERDLNEITDFLLTHGKGAALRFVNAAEEAFEQLSELPELST